MTIPLFFSLLHVSESVSWNHFPKKMLKFWFLSKGISVEIQTLTVYIRLNANNSITFFLIFAKAQLNEYFFFLKIKNHKKLSLRVTKKITQGQSNWFVTYLRFYSRCILLYNIYYYFGIVINMISSSDNSKKSRE